MEETNAVVMNVLRLYTTWKNMLDYTFEAVKYDDRNRRTFRFGPVLWLVCDDLKQTRVTDNPEPEVCFEFDDTDNGYTRKHGMGYIEIRFGTSRALSPRSLGYLVREYRCNADLRYHSVDGSDEGFIQLVYNSNFSDGFYVVVNEHKHYGEPAWDFRLKNL